MKYLHILQFLLLYNMLSILIDGIAIQTQKQVSDTFWLPWSATMGYETPKNVSKWKYGKQYYCRHFLIASNVTLDVKYNTIIQVKFLRIF